VMLNLHNDFIACSGYFRLSVYTWGIFLAYIRNRLSSHLHSRVFGKAGRDKLLSLKINLNNHEKCQKRSDY